MHAVLIEVNVQGVDRDAGLQGLRERIVPAISQMPGFRSGTWLTGDESGSGLSLTVWKTSEHAPRLRGSVWLGTNPQAGASVERCEIREVVATAPQANGDDR